MIIAHDSLRAPEIEPKPGNILDVHFKFYGGDGISLQGQELHQALRKKKWGVFECCCDLPDGKQGLKLPELSYQTPEAEDLRNRIFHPKILENEEELNTFLNSEASKMRMKIGEYIDRNNIRIIHTHNIFSVPFNPVATLAFYELAKMRPDIQFVAQHHDLISEGRQELFKPSPYLKIRTSFDEAVLPVLPNIKHVALSRRAAASMKRGKGINATVISDGYDFGMNIENFPYREDFRRKLGLDENDLVVGVMTRIIPRKAIEFAIQLTKSLSEKRKALEDRPEGVGPRGRKFTKDNKIVLLLAQKEDAQDNKSYFNELKRYAENMGVTIIDAGEHVVSNDSNGSSKHDPYPFFSLYQYIDVLCIPTTAEGFCNQLLEGTVLARDKVPVMFDFPVYENEIRSHIPHRVSLGNTFKLGYGLTDPVLKYIDYHKINQAANEEIYYLLHPEIAKSMAQENYHLAKEVYDIDIIAGKFISLYR